MREERIRYAIEGINTRGTYFPTAEAGRCSTLVVGKASEIEFNVLGTLYPVSGDGLIYMLRWRPAYSPARAVSSDWLAWSYPSRRRQTRRCSPRQATSELKGQGLSTDVALILHKKVMHDRKDSEHLKPLYASCMVCYNAQLSEWICNSYIFS